MNAPLISVIVPIYNVEKYICKCLDSILAQTYSHLEIILVDDGSPDRCGKICDDYAKKDNRIIVIHKSNGGLSEARNAGLDIANGEFIGFVDSDDFIAANMYEILYTSIEKSSADLAICNYIFIKEDETCVGSDVRPLTNKVMTQYEAFHALCDHTNGVFYVTAFNKLYKYSLLNDNEKIRFPIGKLHEDEFIIHHLFHRCKKIITISDTLYYYVQRQNSITAEYSIKRLDAYEAIYDRIIFFKAKGEKELAKKTGFIAYAIIVSALLKLDKAVPKNRKTLYPLFWQVFFERLFCFDLKSVFCLILANQKRLFASIVKNN